MSVCTVIHFPYCPPFDFYIHIYPISISYRNAIYIFYNSVVMYLKRAVLYLYV